MSPPTETLLRKVDLRPKHQPRGNVHYFIEGRPMPRPHSLAIVQRGGDACHLLYLDRLGGEMTESWHRTVDAAIFHAKWEYGIEPEAWE